MGKFFLKDTDPTQSNYRSALPDLIYLPLNMGRFIPRQQDTQNYFISPPSNSVNLVDWINSKIEDGTIQGGGDGDGIYSHSGNTFSNGIATISNTFKFKYKDQSANAISMDSSDGSIQIGSGDPPSAYAFKILLSNDEATITDNIGYGGIRYAADYSSDFDNLSLVTKQYVDSVAGGNGIYGGSGTIAPAASAQLTTGSVFSIDYTSDTIAFRANDTDGSVVLSNSDSSGQLSIDNDETILTGGSYTLQLSGLTEAKFTDSSGNGKGIQYNANYFSTFVPHSLVDKFYVDTLIDGRK